MITSVWVANVVSIIVLMFVGVDMGGGDVGFVQRIETVAFRRLI